MKSMLSLLLSVRHKKKEKEKNMKMSEHTAACWRFLHQQPLLIFEFLPASSSHEEISERSRSIQ